MLKAQPTVKRLTLRLDTETEWLTGEAVTRWASRLERFSVEDNIGPSVLEAGTLELDTIPRDLDTLWFKKAKSLIRGVGFSQRSFDDDLLHFFDPTSDAEALSRVVKALGALGIPVEL